MSIHHLFFGEEMNSGDCPICLDSIGNENGQVEPCFHVFCLKCIQDWTATSVNCPVCRGRLTSINGSQLETSGMAGLAGDAIGQDQVVATQTDRCEECDEPLEILGMLLCSHCRNRLYRCEECTEDILSEDENFWFCPRCEQWTPCPTPAIGNSTFQIEEPEYALYQFENQEDTNSRDNPSTSFNSSNATITYHQNTNVMDQIVLAMNKERNTPGLTTSLSDKKVSSLLSN
ncbi:unnamed protein product [Porites evermanni]|uniref:RING-type domain-containing protein n=1 Tax=Porites evermanni TaxID=104178 RepID=A0ABN8QMU8_9CNID|nr:unnamed protein product [Porites evermanni]